ncbi:MICAL-like protein 2 isoform 2-T2 [Porphyrio hochstetteri]
MAAIQNLQLWCKQQCEGYRDVSITNMTTSFRDGLAFCAILHRHRPDLINFDSLSKENVYENNKLAFRVAEEELGIPALLDAEDMVALRVPDRLSILTYVSQYYNYFHGRSPIGGMAGIKRPSSEPQEQPLGKKAVSEPPKPVPPKLPPAAPPARAKPKEISPVTKKVLAESGNVPSSSCGICGSHVHLVQRYLVDGKLYHRNCFRCRQCWNMLLPGSYKAGPEPGTFICTSHQQPDSVQISGLRSTGSKPESTPAPPAARAFQKAAEPKKLEQVLKKPSQEGLANSTKPSVSSFGSSGFKSVNTPWSSSAVNKSADCRGTPLGNKTDHHEGTPSGLLQTASTTKTQQAREHFFQSFESSSNKSSDTKKQAPPSHGPGKAASARTTPEVRPVNAEKDQARNHIIQALAGSNTSPNRPGGLNSIGSSVSSRPGGLSSTGSPLSSRSGGLHSTGSSVSSRSGGLSSTGSPLSSRSGGLNSTGSPVSSRSGGLNSTGSPLSSRSGGLNSTGSPVSSRSGGLNSTGSSVSSRSGGLNSTGSPLSSRSGGLNSTGSSVSSRPGGLNSTGSPLSSRSGGLNSTGSPVSSSGKFAPTSSPWQSPAPKPQPSKIGCPALKQEKIADPLPKSQAASKPLDAVHKLESKGTKGNITVGEDKSESPAEWRSLLKPVASKDQGGSKKPTDNSQVGTGSPAHKETKPSPLVVPSAKQDSASSGGFMKKLLIPSSDLTKSCQNSKQSWEDHGGSVKKEEEGNQLKKSTTTFQPSASKSIQSPEVVSPTKLHPDYLPEKEIQEKVCDIEKQLDELELKGVELEKQLRGCEGDESEDALMVDWFKLIHEKQLLLRQESELMYKMKQQKLEEQQWNIETELRHLMSKPEELKTPRDKEREQELLESYLNTVNDRNNIVECLDEDRLREQEEDQMLADMIQRLDGSLESTEPEKKKNKFCLSKIWKQKNKGKAQE